MNQNYLLKRVSSLFTCIFPVNVNYTINHLNIATHWTNTWCDFNIKVTTKCLSFWFLNYICHRTWCATGKDFMMIQAVITFRDTLYMTVLILNSTRYWMVEREGRRIEGKKESSRVANLFRCLRSFLFTSSSFIIGSGSFSVCAWPSCPSGAVPLLAFSSILSSSVSTLSSTKQRTNVCINNHLCRVHHASDFD